SDTNYQRGTILYSCKHDRDEHQNTAILDEAMQYCVRTERNVLEVHDILLAAMEVFEKQLRFKSGGDEGESNGSSEIMLFQVCEKHYDSLNISFNDMKRYIMNMDGKGKRFMLPGHIFR
ncbi:MAG: hypothetical protein Q8930_17920, partial [Bacillota bacterium]|nr:hypothetical protein [Bacillota bacterium]